MDKLPIDCLFLIISEILISNSKNNRLCSFACTSKFFNKLVKLYRQNEYAILEMLEKSKIDDQNTNLEMLEKSKIDDQYIIINSIYISKKYKINSVFDSYIYSKADIDKITSKNSALYSLLDYGHRRVFMQYYDKLVKVSELSDYYVKYTFCRKFGVGINLDNNICDVLDWASMTNISLLSDRVVAEYAEGVGQFGTHENIASFYANNPTFLKHIVLGAMRSGNVNKILPYLDNLLNDDDIETMFFVAIVKDYKNSCDFLAKLKKLSEEKDKSWIIQAAILHIKLDILKVITSDKKYNIVDAVAYAVKLSNLEMVSYFMNEEWSLDNSVQLWSQVSYICEPHLKDYIRRTFSSMFPEYSFV